MVTFLQDNDEQRLRQIVRTATSESDRTRASLLLDFEAGLSAREISEKLDAPVHRVLHWRREYLKRGMEIFR